MKILVVEDQRRLGLFLKKNLSEHGYTTMWVQTCDSARDAMCENRYDLVILDLGLPDGSGLELLREWRLRDPAAADAKKLDFAVEGRVVPLAQRANDVVRGG